MRNVLSIMLVVLLVGCGHYGHEYAKIDHEHSHYYDPAPIIEMPDIYPLPERPDNEEWCTCNVLTFCPDGRPGCLVAHYLGCEIHTFEERFRWGESIPSVTGSFLIGNATGDLILDATSMESLTLKIHSSGNIGL